MTATTEKLSYWTELTENNAHNEARADIAEFYAGKVLVFNICKWAFARIEEAATAGGMTVKLATERQQQTDFMLKAINTFFGTEEAKAVAACL